MTDPMPLVDLRLRTRLAPDALASMKGKLLAPEHHSLRLTGPTMVRKPDGRPLCVYLPGWLADQVADPELYRVLHGLRVLRTDNRGDASGTKRLQYGEQKRTRTKLVASTVVGALDSRPGMGTRGSAGYCRLSAWTAKNLPDYAVLRPLLQRMALGLQLHVPDRWAAQVAEADRTEADYVVPGTPFTTVTVNNTYSTGVHTDRGDLAAGFSTLAVLRRGYWTGGYITFPEYQVGADLAEGDLLLMDAHDWHGNTPMTCACGTSPLLALCRTCAAERISVVAYFRERMPSCGDLDTELAKAQQQRQQQLRAAGVAEH